MRGCNVSANKIPENILNRVHPHINIFSSCESHYSHCTSSKINLGPELNREEMYELYLGKCKEDKVPK